MRGESAIEPTEAASQVSKRNMNSRNVGLLASSHGVLYLGLSRVYIVCVAVSVYLVTSPLCITPFLFLS